MSEYVKFAHELADASGKVIRKYFRSKMTVKNKPDDSPVTVADQQTESVMRQMISEKRKMSVEWNILELQAAHLLFQPYILRLPVQTQSEQDEYVLLYP